MTSPFALLPRHERPREKAIKFGMSNLSNQELLAIILRTGTRQMSVLDLANFVLSHFQGLPGLMKTNLEQLKAVKGLKEAKALELLAAIEIARRAPLEISLPKEKIMSAERVYEIFKPLLKDEPQEHFYLILLNTKNGLITYKRLFIGGLDTNLIHPRDIFREAVTHNAAKIIFVHNHPTGDPTPSEADIYTTRGLAEIGKMMGIAVLDHVIIGSTHFSSLKSMKHF